MNIGKIGRVIYNNKKCFAYCRPLCKYSLESNSWNKPKKNEERNAFSIVMFDRFFGIDKDSLNENVEYIITMNGNKAENYSLTGGNNGWGAKNYISYIDNINGKYRLLNILLDNDGPLEEQSKKVASLINYLLNKKECLKIYVLGVSKCGTMVLSMLKYINDDKNNKINLISYSAPYLGTIFASPKILYEKLDDLKKSFKFKMFKNIMKLMKFKILKNELGDIKEDNIIDKIKDIYWSIFSKSHMDFDISIKGHLSIPDEYIKRYDETYLENIVSKSNLENLKKFNFTNVTTCCNFVTLLHCIKNKIINGIRLYFYNKLIFEKKSDGMVTLSSARYIEKLCKVNDIKINKIKIWAGHHDIAKDYMIVKKVFSKILVGK